jgi:hypothetical protein
LDFYISALQVSWFKRIMDKPVDNWRRDIYRLCGGNPLIANSKLAERKKSPVLQGLFAEFEKFRLSFLGRENNLLKADLLYNPMAGGGRGPYRYLQKISSHITYRQLAFKMQLRLALTG